ncbi:unnamed protein product [Diamesa serratosioi]
MEDNYYLELSEEELIKFDPVNALTNVFFDDTKKQIFCIKSSKCTVKSVKGNSTLLFHIDNKSDVQGILAIKFSPDNSILAIQRTESSIELNSFQNNQIIQSNSIQYNTSKNTVIYGFFWNTSEFVIVTTNEIEIFQINSSKRSMKSLKNMQINSNWFVWNKTSSFVVLSSNNGTILTPVLVKPGSFNKLSSIYIENGQGITERDLYLGNLYGCPAILILQQSRNEILEIVIYLLNGSGMSPVKSHILKLGFSGRVAVNIVDNVIIVHHQTSRTSFLFDVALNGQQDPGNKQVLIHMPLIPPKSIKPYRLKIPSLNDSSINIDLYSSNWVLFQPNVVIDVKLGYLFELKLKIEPLCRLIGDRGKLIEFLLRRQNAKNIILHSVLLQLMINENHNLILLEQIFDKFNKTYKIKLEYDLQSQIAIAPTSVFQKTPTTNLSVPMKEVVIDQHDIIQIFATIDEKLVLEKTLLVYIYSLARNAIACDYDLSKLLVVTLINNKKFHLLQQILSYNVLNESKPLACFLLSMSNIDPIISQMALDMLKRLNADEIIVEILLEKGKVRSFLNQFKFTNSEAIPARKFLDAAWKTENKMIIYSVFNFFLTRNQRLRNSTDFLKIEKCDEFVKKFEELFPGN